MKIEVLSSEKIKIMDKLELLKKRKSVRSYSLEELPQETINKLKAETTDINTHVAGLKFQLFFNDDDPFK